MPVLARLATCVAFDHGCSARLTFFTLRLDNHIPPEFLSVQIFLTSPSYKTKLRLSCASFLYVPDLAVTVQEGFLSAELVLMDVETRREPFLSVSLCLFSVSLCLSLSLFLTVSLCVSLFVSLPLSLPRYRSPCVSPSNFCETPLVFVDVLKNTCRENVTCSGKHTDVTRETLPGREENNCPCEPKTSS